MCFRTTKMYIHGGNIFAMNIDNVGSLIWNNYSHLELPSS